MKISIENQDIEVKPGVPLLWYEEYKETGSDDCKCSYCQNLVEENAVRITDKNDYKWVTVIDQYGIVNRFMVMKNLQLVLHHSCYLQLIERDKIKVPRPVIVEL